MHALRHINNGVRHCLSKNKMHPCLVKGWTNLHYYNVYRLFMNTIFFSKNFFQLIYVLIREVKLRYQLTKRTNQSKSVRLKQALILIQIHAKLINSI